MRRPLLIFAPKNFRIISKKGGNWTNGYCSRRADYAHQRNIRLIVVVLPAIYQVYEQAWNQYFTTYHADPNKYDLYKPQTLMDEFCSGHQIECVDMLSCLRLAGKEQRLYYEIDSHMRPAGHRVVADSLCSYLSAVRPSTVNQP